VANDGFIGDLESDFFRLSMSFDGKKTKERHKYLTLTGYRPEKSIMWSGLADEPNNTKQFTRSHTASLVNQ
jgi:hypothetical protein